MKNNKLKKTNAMFKAGIMACKKGYPCLSKSAAFTAGYGRQYTKEARHG